LVRDDPYNVRVGNKVSKPFLQRSLGLDNVHLAHLWRPCSSWCGLILHTPTKSEEREGLSGLYRVPQVAFSLV
jgi:hypothetical protein